MAKTNEKIILKDKDIESFIEESAKILPKEELEPLGYLIPESQQGVFGGFSEKYKKKLDDLSRLIPKITNLNLLDFFHISKKIGIQYASLYRKGDGEFDAENFMKNIRISITNSNNGYNINLNLNKKPKKSKNININIKL